MGGGADGAGGREGGRRTCCSAARMEGSSITEPRPTFMKTGRLEAAAASTLPDSRSVVAGVAGRTETRQSLCASTGPSWSNSYYVATKTAPWVRSSWCCLRVGCRLRRW